ncbi:MAG: T9SS type A sorting domain-containing protein [Bacteroidales bacterium]|nr:T9SS type A sorting domain-containing protein [Bacteroidales bacterium]
MRKTLLLATLILASTLALAQSYNVQESSYSTLRIAFTTPKPTIEEASLLKQTFNLVALDGFSYQSEAGQPALPTLVKTVEVPVGSGLTYSVESMRCDTLDGAQLGLSQSLLPAQPSRSKSDTSAAMLVQDLETYSTDAFCGAPLIVLQEIGVARDRNLATVTYNPVRWNPVTNQLIIVRELTVSIQQQNADIAATQRLHQHYSPAFGTGINAINSLGTKDSYTQGPLRYTIVAHSMFRGELDEFAAWKRRKGFMVDLVYTDDAAVGSTLVSIKAYLKSLYDTASTAYPAPTYVLLVGDVAQIPAESLTFYGEHHWSDLNYCCWTSGDYIPDCYYGRFSAQNVSQLTPQISKTLMYEQYTFPDDSYLNVSALIAGVDAANTNDNAYCYADPSMDYIAKTYVTAANGFSSIHYYKNNTAFAPTGVTVTGSSNDYASATALRDLYDNGCGWVNYSAHGNTTEWYKPSFTNTHVAQMTNNNKPQVMIGNCCLSNSFQIDACLGEALLRKGNNAGAVAYIGASNSTYWLEDFYWTVGIRSTINNTCNPSYDASNLGMYDRLFHQHGEAYADWYTCMSGLIYAGNMAVQSSTSSLKQYYWQIYHLMGDPSLMPYNKGQAATMSPNMPSAAVVGINSLSVTAVPYAYVALKAPDSTLLGATFADANGQANLSFATLHLPGVYEVAITAQNYKPYFQDLVVTADGPFVAISTIEPTAEPVAGSNLSFNMTLENLGVDDADSLFVEFQSPTGQFVFDTVGWRTLDGGLAHGQELTLTATGSGHIWGGTPDQTQLPIKVLVRWGNTSSTLYSTLLGLTVAADNVRLSAQSLQMSPNDSTTATLMVTNRNNGHATLQHADVTLLSLDPVLNISSYTATLENLEPDQEAVTSYTLTFNGSAPDDHDVPVIQYINNGQRTNADTLMLRFNNNHTVIDFDDNTWGDVSWSNGTYPWQLSQTSSHSGTYSASSYTWTTSNPGSNSNSVLSLTWTSTVDDTLSFYRRVSSESGYDFFRFYIDGSACEAISGTTGNWGRSAYYVSAGTHTFKWSYEKDYSASAGSDCAWIDDITLPISGTVHNYLLDTICLGQNYVFGTDTLWTDTLTEGYHYFADTIESAINHLILYLAAMPQVAIEGGDVTIRRGEGVRLTATGANNYLWSNGLTVPSFDAHPTETTTYSVIGQVGRCSGEASTTITVDGTLIGIDQTTADATACRLFPNPAHHGLTVEGSAVARIIVRNTLGQTLIDQAATQRRTQLDISQLPTGLYIVQTLGADGQPQGMAKFLKK